MTRKTSKARKTRKQGRDARTGRFISIKEAEERPSTTVIESVPLPGRGDTTRKPRKRKPSRKK